ncbi:tyrosine-protein phosphatase non-receptor type 21 isoform X1 [Nerophis lumbriciformis]|uniref:tyrosine-protein phosphatase non-receptor type 21 isoform X1 n=1 Tax=Nerophis lumbriciformis TaxID=546530 RepID=UPI002AE05BE2|nr:tyrosine-protein phosphatase non-receptor type 21-like isoform X1 [Nerophis lumbriciformis]
MPLPFGLKLKRTRRYTVSSKSCLVTRIQQLNGEFVEFTLSVESTGQECLEAVAQRLELREITYFSLWYFNKQNQQRWIDPDKPLKKQLDKYGAEPTVYFGVVFYIPSVAQLQQEITRYQYYLQLKKDVLEGRISCTLEQAIRLASLAVQADFGDVDRYDSQEFLQKCALFPIDWIQEERVLEEATQKVALLYQSYRGLPAPEAEMLYMQEVEKMEGYGQENYQAKDHTGTDVTLGSCLDGIFVKHKNGSPLNLFRWNDINNMSHNRSFFALELLNREESVQFQTEDMETSKYVCRMCLARLKFYKINKSSLEECEPQPSEGSQKSLLTLSFPRFSMLSRPSPSSNKGQTQPTVVNTVRRRSSTRLSLPKPQGYMMPPPQMHYNGHFTEPYSSSQDNLYMNSQNGYYYHSQTSLDCPPMEYGSGGRLRNGSVYSAHSTSSLTNPQHYLQPSPMSSNPSITSDITRPDYIPSHRHSALIPPSYRATPDYETVMRQKNRGGGRILSQEHRQSHSMRNLNIGNSYAYSRPDPLVYSQPEIRGEHGGTVQQHHHHYPFQTGSSFHSPSPYHPYPTERRPVVGAVSVPELTNVQLQQVQEYPAPNIMRTQVYRPPPPYPYAHPRPANSTPDLSRHLYVSSSNPDLIITRRVHHSVQTFQEDSLPVAHSLQEVSEPLLSGPPHRPTYHGQKRNSIEVAGLAQSLEGIRLKERHMSSSAAEAATPPPVPQVGRSQGSQLNVFLERTKTADKADAKDDVQYGHKKSLSDATMLVHSSGEDEEFEEDTGRHTPLSHDAIAAIIPEQPPPPPLQQQHHAFIAPSQQQTPLEPPPAYPIGSTMDPSLAAALTYKVHPLIQEKEPPYLPQTRIMPSVSEGDLSGEAKHKSKKDFKRRPVADVPQAKKTIEGLPPPGMKSVRLNMRKMGPLKVAHLNGLSVSRHPAQSDVKDEPEQASNDEKCKDLERHMEMGELLKEYESVPKSRPSGECTVAQMPESADKNRFQDVLPYDDTRVELVPTKENNTGYINASHIKLNVGGHEWNYIATQGPLVNTCQDFWQMVWEQGVAIIAMVTAEEESGREKSFRYWPRLGSRHNPVTYGRFKITTRFRTESGCYATTGLKIRHQLTNQERTVWHLQYTDWPDHGCPENLKGFLTYLDEIQSVRRHTNSTSDVKTNLPVLVHCTAGVGRSGVVILCEIMIACQEHNKALEVRSALLKLRNQRMMMVQTLSQYNFIYKVLIQYLQNSRLI